MSPTEIAIILLTITVVMLSVVIVVLLGLVIVVLARLRTLAAAWAAEHSAPHGRLRLDVISVLLRPGLPAELRHHRGVGLT